MSLLWPAAKVHAFTPMVRLGRVLHWAALVAGGLWLALWLVVAHYGDPGSSGLATGVGAAGMVAGILVGRAVRYVLSGE